MPEDPTEREQQAWREFWELIGEATYQLWREKQTQAGRQEAA